MYARLPSILATAVLSGATMVVGIASAQGVAPPTPLGESHRPYWSDGWRGWHFYEDPPQEELVPTARPALVDLPPISEKEKSRKNLPAPEYCRNAP